MESALDKMKAARKAHGPISEDLKALRREQRTIQRAITDALANGAMTVPSLAAATELPAHKVFWHINALRKYGILTIEGKDEEYLTYALVTK